MREKNSRLYQEYKSESGHSSSTGVVTQFIGHLG